MHPTHVAAAITLALSIPLATAQTLRHGEAPEPVEISGAYDGDNVVLRSHMSPSDFGTYQTGNDCWGYVSPSGREYALMGLNAAMAFVEITDPSNPVVVGLIPHADNPWADVKTYEEYAYIVNEAGDGIQVVDMSDIDNGVVTLVRSVTGLGLWTAHNVAINEDSGRLYLCGANSPADGLVIYDLTADPSNPQFLGTYNGFYVHDAQIITMPDGPWAGREIAFCFAAEAGIDVVDVTDPSNTVRLSRTTYPGLNYSHQGWYDATSKLIYQNDELDEQNGDVATTTTRVFDASDLTDLELVGTFGADLESIDHNCYVRDGFIYQANYSSGLRIFEIDDSGLEGAMPVEAGYFDSFPPNDGTSYNGAWSNYPYFPSGNVLISDYDSGMFIVDPTFALNGGAPFTYAVAPPEYLTPSDQAMNVFLTLTNGEYQMGSGVMRYEVDGVEGTIPLMLHHTDGDLVHLMGMLPDLPCGEEITYWFSAQSTSGLTVNSPASAPLYTYSGLIADSIKTRFDDDLETDMGWTVGSISDGATTGVWERADPESTSAQPGDDFSDPGTLCFVTGASAGFSIGTNDVDGGSTTLTSPVLDASGDGPTFLSFAIWYSNDQGGNPVNDTMLVEISDDDGLSWAPLDTLSESTAGWEERSYALEGVVDQTDLVRVRFIARDLNGGNIVEAAVDEVRLRAAVCLPPSLPADFNGDGEVDFTDLNILLSAFGDVGMHLPGDADDDGEVDFTDLNILLSSFGDSV